MGPLEIFEAYLGSINCRKLLIPGDFDPVDSALPYPPIPEAFWSGIEQLDSLSNPAWFEIDNLSFLCSSGTAVLDLMRHTGMSFTECQEYMVRWRLIAPTVPAALLGCLEEVLVMTEMPNFFVCGSSDALYVNSLKGVTFLAIPGFAEHRSAVVLDLTNGEATSVSFA
jgi:DNA polymerase II small subunit/DNA polymerase delta subunit B